MRHAFIITAHNNVRNLNRLLTLLDDERNVILLHIDAKVNLDDFQLVHLKRARLHVISSIKIYWADVSQIKCTLDLIRMALTYDWDYCHYVPESCLPLKTMEEIDRFFSEKAGQEFIDYAPGNYRFAQYKANVYHFFTGYPVFRTNKLLRGLSHVLAKIQMKLGVRRYDTDFKHGSAYFSISRELCRYIDERSDEIFKKYKWTLASDEVWLQTLISESEYLSRVHCYEMKHMGNLRYIDWKRRNGNSPYTFQETDFTELIDIIENTPICFARKFAQESAVADQVVEYLLSPEE